MIVKYDSDRYFSVDILCFIRYLERYFSDVQCYVMIAKATPEMDRDSVWEFIREDVDVEIETNMSDFVTYDDVDSNYDAELYADDDPRTLVNIIIDEMGGDYLRIIDCATDKVMMAINM